MIKNKNKQGFTLAEVLITLSIIGVIAAILFPSILANYTERTLGAKRSALVSRMSQAMAELSDQFANYEDASCTNPADTSTCSDQGSALKFINEGLSKVYKVAAVCDKDSLSACDIPNEITRADGTTFPLGSSISFIDYNPKIYSDVNTLKYNTYAAAFMTKNGESILLFTNPSCEGKVYDTEAHYAENKICVNMVYDLNGGKNKPNRVGEDIGFISVFYGNSPQVVAPRPYDYRAVPDYTITENSGVESYVRKTYTFQQAKDACSSLGENVSLPSLEEAMSLQINTPLIMDKSEIRFAGYFWTSSWASFYTHSSLNYGELWVAYQRNGTDDNDRSLYISYTNNLESEYLAKCVYTTNY